MNSYCKEVNELNNYQVFWCEGSQESLASHTAAVLREKKL